MNENILVVEQREELLNRFSDILRERHYNPIPTKSRSQAVMLSNENKIDLILLDSDIAQSQGLTLVETFKNQESTKDTPLILLTTPYKKTEFIDEAVNLGIDGLLFIPFDEIDFVIKVYSSLKIKKLYLELEKTRKRINYLEEEISNVTETSNKNIKLFQDIQKKYEDTLNIDLETGLYNKKEFYIQFTRLVYESVRHEETIVLVCFSIDGIENIVNEFGIMASENITTKFADILKNITRKEDILSRFDDNEFIAAFKRMNEKLYENKIEEIKSMVDKNEFDYDGMIIKFSVSVGICSTRYKNNYHIENMDKEISPVLLALHNAKRRGIGSVFVHPTIIRS